MIAGKKFFNTPQIIMWVKKSFFSRLVLLVQYRDKTVKGCTFLLLQLASFFLHAKFIKSMTTAPQVKYFFTE